MVLPKVFDEFQNDFFPITDDEEVDKICHRLRVESTAATGDDQRVRIIPVFCQNRYLCQVEHIKDIGIGKLIS